MPSTNRSEEREIVKIEEEAVPLVIVEGFLCSTSTAAWGEFADHLDIGSAAHDSQTKGQSSTSPRLKGKRKVILVPIGPLSSIHDRACELFHALRGTTVDYGHDHSSMHGHSRYGRQARQPLLPGWGDNLKEGSVIGKAHFLGHSLGGLTILKMYQLLCDGFFSSYLTMGNGLASSQLVLSLTTISSPHRGTPLVYLLGSERTSIPLVRFLSTGDCLAKFVHVLLWARRLPLARNQYFNIDDWIPDFFADAWQFASQSRIEECYNDTATDGDDEGSECNCAFIDSDDHRDAKSSESWKIGEFLGLKSLFSQLKKSSWAEGKDCAPWDCTFTQREADEMQKDTIWSSDRSRMSRDPVWLRSYAAYIDKGSEEDDVPSKPKTFLSSLFESFAWNGLLSEYDYSSSLPPGSRISVKEDADDCRHIDSGYTSASEDKSTTLIRKRGERARTSLIRVDEDWYRNDGIVPLASQFHPGQCKSSYCQHVAWHSDETFPRPSLLNLDIIYAAARWLFPGSFKKHEHHRISRNVENEESMTKQAFSPSSNVWHVSILKNTTHASLAPFFTGSQKQLAFWQDVGFWLQQVEQASTSQHSSID